MAGGSILQTLIGKIILEKELKKEDEQSQDDKQNAKGTGEEAHSGRSAAAAAKTLLGHFADRTHRDDRRQLQGIGLRLILLLGLGQRETIQILDQLLRILIALKDVGVHRLERDMLQLRRKVGNQPGRRYCAGVHMLHGDFHIKNIMRQNGENLLIDMDTLSMGHPVYEFAAIYAAYVGFGCLDMSKCYNFLGISEDQCKDFWKYTLKYYFEGKDDEYIASIQNMASIICYTRLVRRTIKRFGLEDEENRALVEFCKNYLIENVPKTEKLYF